MRTYVKDIHKIATRVALSVAIAATGWAAAPQAIAQEVAAPAATVDEARIFAEDGNYDDAIATLRRVVAESPKNTQAQMFLGELLWNSGRDDEALSTYRALQKGNREATLRLAEIALSRLETDESRDLLAAYRASLKRGRKVLAEDESGDLESRIDRAEGMLDRVQNIEVIDSVDVDAEDFFAAYPMSPAAGRFSDVGVLPASFPSDDATVVHITESGNRMVWSAPDAEGAHRLYGSAALLGDEWEKPRQLGDNLAEGGDAVYPYLMPDGITLYYSNDGDNSLGGYDIYMSRQGDDGFLQPVNMGLPFNSSANDYLLVIDEFTGAGWFATDRNRHPGKVTIYTFIPQEMRRNVDVDNPNLASLARLDNIALTQQQGKDYTPVRRAIARGVAINDRTPRKQDFLFPISGNRVYTSLNDFHNPRARQLMSEYLKKQQKFKSITDRLAALRLDYGRGEASQAELIRELEKQLPAARAELRTMRDDIVTLEVN